VFSGILRCAFNHCAPPSPSPTTTVITHTKKQQQQTKTASHIVTHTRVHKRTTLQSGYTSYLACFAHSHQLTIITILPLPISPSLSTSNPLHSFSSVIQQSLCLSVSRTVPAVFFFSTLAPSVDFVHRSCILIYPQERKGCTQKKKENRNVASQTKSEKKDASLKKGEERKKGCWFDQIGAFTEDRVCRTLERKKKNKQTNRGR
jgi:hypothetical protein